MNSSKLSIIIPVYNVEQWLDECLRSIQNQIFEEWECILVNDGSTDSSGAICDLYARNDIRFKVYHQMNHGVSMSRNVGIDLSIAPYISFIDPDDYISENFYSVMMDCVFKNKAQCVAARTAIIHRNKENHFMSDFINSDKNTEQKYWSNNKDILKEIHSLITGGPWGYVFERVLWEKIRFPVGIDLAEDVAVIPVVIARCKSAVYAPEAIYYHRIREKSLMSQTLSKERYVKSLQATSMMYETISAEFPEYKRPFREMKLASDLFRFFDYLKAKPERTGSRLLLLSQLMEEAEKELKKHE